MKRKHKKVRKQIFYKKKKSFLSFIFILLFSIFSKLFVCLFLLIIIWFLLLKLLFPLIFVFSENQTILLISPDKNNNLTKMNLINFNIDNKVINFFNFNPEIKVELIGSNESVALSSTYLFLKETNIADNEIKNNLSFSLKEHINNIYFLPTSFNEISNWEDFKKEMVGFFWLKIKKMKFSFTEWQWFITLSNFSSSNFKFHFINQDNFDTYHQLLAKNTNWSNCPISILNASGQIGLSWKFVNLLESKGFLITRTDTNDQILDSSEIYYDENGNCAHLLENFSFFFPKNLKINSNKDKLEENRCQFLIILGKDVCQ